MGQSLKEIKGRLDSVRKTRKITNAMYLLSAARLRKDLSSADFRTEYTDKLRLAVANVLSSPEAEKLHSPFLKENPGMPALYLVVTGDKGLCGSYNSDVVKAAKAAAAEKEALTGIKPLVYGFGKAAAECMRRIELPADKMLEGSASHPEPGVAAGVADELFRAYEEKKAGEAYIVCSPYAKGGGKPECIRFLPLDEKLFAEVPVKPEKTDFEPDITSVFHAVVKAYCSGTVYSLLVLSSLSEHSARSEAMREATDNADEMAQKLESDMNALRQLGITNEITEIAAAAKARK